MTTGWSGVLLTARRGGLLGGEGLNLTAIRGGG